MKKSLISCIMIIIFIAAGIVTASSAQRTWAWINGIVETEDGKPLQGAKITLIHRSDKMTYEVKTNKKGKWRKASIRPGVWDIKIEAEGYVPQEVVMERWANVPNKLIHIRLIRIPEPPFKKGDTLYEEKKFAEALQEYQRELAENPDLYLAHMKIGLCHFGMDDLDNAIGAFKRFLDKEPKSREALINLSSSYFSKGELEEGMKYFNQLDEKSLSDPNLFYNIGILLFMKGQMDMAIDYFDKCIALDSNYFEAYYQLALANINKGNMEEAKKNLQKVVELAPESEQAVSAKKMLETIE